MWTFERGMAEGWIGGIDIKNDLRDFRSRKMMGFWEVILFPDMGGLFMALFYPHKQGDEAIQQNMEVSEIIWVPPNHPVIRPWLSIETPGLGIPPCWKSSVSVHGVLASFGYACSSSPFMFILGFGRKIGGLRLLMPLLCPPSWWSYLDTGNT